MIRILIADDSAFMRKVLSDLFRKQPDFEVVGTARNGQEAIKLVKQEKPDLLTLDVNMPVMDGLNALAVIMEESPMPVVMLSSLTQEGTEATVRALSLGAVDFISKAGGSISRIDTIEPEILQKCRNAVKAHVQKPKKQESPPKPAVPVMRRVAFPGLKREPPRQKSPSHAKLALARTPNPLLQRRKPEFQPKPLVIERGSGQKLVAIGTSTGGPQALQNVITRLPADLPCGVVVVQHMPPHFTKALADRLNTISAISVKEAEDGEVIRPGQVYIAPGGFHLRVRPDGTDRRIALGTDPPVGNHRPCVNVMFDSVATFGQKVTAVIMTGMGSDGCEGMKKIKAAGGYSIAQDEDSCVVYGMPRAVVEAGLADEVKPVEQIASAIVSAVKR